MDQAPCHMWNVSNDPARRSRVKRHLSDYYQNEELSVISRTTPDNFNTQYLHRALPRQHALVLAALGSSSRFVSRDFPVVSGYEHVAANKRFSCGGHHDDYHHEWFQSASARCHDTCYESSLTRISSPYQKHHLTALSGITGLLVTRLMSREKTNSIKTIKKQAEITNRRIHSTLAAECLAGNRYYRTLTMCRVDVRHPVGFIVSNAKTRLTADDMTSEAIAATHDKLRETYNANIDRLMMMTSMFKRGFVSIDQIRKDPQFVEMKTAFWRLANQLMRLKEDVEAVAQPPNGLDLESQMLFSERKNAKRISAISFLAEPAAIAPKLYDYDITHLLDGETQSYTNYVKVAKHTYARLACDGSVASFLAFAAIEPELTTKDCAIRIGGKVDEFHGLSLKACANHIPSRHPVFGALRLKHRCHIMRTADAVNTSSERVHPRLDSPQMGVTRTEERFNLTYTPLCDIVEDIQRTSGIDMLRKFPERKNSGKVISVNQADNEFKARVYPLGMLDSRQHTRRWCNNSDDYDYDDYDRDRDDREDEHDYEDDYEDDYDDGVSG